MHKEKCRFVILCSNNEHPVSINAKMDIVHKYDIHAAITGNKRVPVRADNADAVALAEAVGEILQEHALAQEEARALELGHHSAQALLPLLLLSADQLHLLFVHMIMQFNGY